MEDLNEWVAIAAGWLTLIQHAITAAKWLLPKIRESLRQWRATRKR